MLEHRFAQLAAACTFVLLVIGGTVNPTGSSLACPEATIVCHGQILPEMTGGVLYEHGHRLAAMTVGLLQIVLTVLLLRRRTGAARIAWGLLAMVVLQGLLGAITVQYKLPWFVSTGHLLLGFTYFASLLWVAWWTGPERRAVAADATVRRWTTIGAVTVAVQLLLGGLVRHSEATLACIGLPGCAAGDLFGAAALQQLHMLHRAWGVVVGAVTIVAALKIARRAPELRWLAVAAPLLVLAQIALGAYVVWSFRSVPVAVAHFAGAAALWGVWARAWFTTHARIRDEGQLLAPVRGIHAVP
jgi:cytochrome c oxidase assembly protein subunit 15